MKKTELLVEQHNTKIPRFNEIEIGTALVAKADREYYKEVTQLFLLGGFRQRNLLRIFFRGQWGSLQASIPFYFSKPRCLLSQPALIPFISASPNPFYLGKPQSLLSQPALVPFISASPSPFYFSKPQSLLFQQAPIPLISASPSPFYLSKPQSLLFQQVPIHFISANLDPFHLSKPQSLLSQQASIPVEGF